MKKKNLFSLALMLMAAAMLSFTACGKDDDEDPIVEDPIPEGLIGNWVSEGENVAPLLVQFNIAKIIALFDENGTYLVESYDPDGVKTELVGTYVMEESAVADIWNITLSQSSPTSLTSEGIFQIIEAENGREMKYEVVQTDPSLGFAPPTAAAGFGSTGGGVFGQTNVQYYIEIAE
ncbi:MAG: hypothetical protein EA361_10410 [Bacteroidetes bacterium]|nr:MAG: hypothetical protein EA361_10410 [Bacteroidota bacterium]